MNIAFEYAMILMEYGAITVAKDHTFFAICQRVKGKSVVFPSYQSISTSKQLYKQLWYWFKANQFKYI